MKKIQIIAVAALGSSLFSQAAITVLDFEGLQNQESIDNFYNGGTGSLGSIGFSYGITFGGQSVALIDEDAGGTGNFANEPTSDTIMFFPDANTSLMNVLAGFDTGFSFFYAAFQGATVSVFDDLDGTGNVLATLSLPATPTNTGNGDPNGFYDTWSAIGVSFSGVAKSVAFSGAANNTGFDNITFGSETPIVNNEVPEAGTYAAGALVAAALGGLWFKRRKA